MGIFYSLLIGCLAGFCAGKLMKGGGFGQLGTAIVGAVAILWVASLIKK